MEEFTKEKIKVGLLVGALFIALGFTFFQSSIFQEDLLVISQESNPEESQPDSLLKEEEENINSQPEESTNSESEELTNSQFEKTITVHVVGAVKKPGIYVLPEGARIYQAMELAVPTERADMTSLNLAQTLEDGEQIYLWPKESGQPEGNKLARDPGNFKQGATNPSQQHSSIKGKININKASSKELETLPGIGPALAERIVTHREEIGLFQKGEDLLKVSGIGTKKYEGLKDHIVW